MDNKFRSFIDRDKTAALVNDYDEPCCECEDCRFYYSYAENTAGNARDFFGDLGIDLTKIRELEIMNEHGSCGLILEIENFCNFDKSESVNPM